VKNLGKEIVYLQMEGRSIGPLFPGEERTVEANLYARTAKGKSKVLVVEEN
jgi:hypothetical protein